MKLSVERKEENKAILQRDKDLIKDSLKGNTDSFAVLMSHYYNRVKYFGCRFFPNPADLEDFIQEVFLKVFKNLSGFRGESSFATWITRIAFTTALNTKERTKDFAGIPEGMDFESGMDTPEEHQIKSLTRDAVNEAVKELPEKYAVCLDLYFFHDMSHEEISAITDFPINTIKSHIFRAKKILRDKLKDFSSG